MKSKTIISIVLFPLFAFSCLWIDGTTIDGKHEYSGPIEMMFQSIVKQSPKDKLKYYYSSDEYLMLYGLKKQEMDAVRILLDGNSLKAIEILKDVESKSPNNYSVASNLGTAYELNSDNKNARIWIKEGMKRNPKSHYSTEWLHKIILDAKIIQENNASYLIENRIIPLESSFKENNITIDGKQYNINDISRALIYQLKERISLVKPKDIFIADLLYTYALITANTRTVEEALYLLQLSKEYGFLDQKLLDKTKKEYEQISENHSFSYHLTQMRKWITIENPLVLVALFLIWVLIYYYRKGRKAKLE